MSTRCGESAFNLWEFNGQINSCVNMERETLAQWSANSISLIVTNQPVRKRDPFHVVRNTQMQQM